MHILFHFYPKTGTVQVAIKTSIHSIDNSHLTKRWTEPSFVSIRFVSPQSLKGIPMYRTRKFHMLPFRGISRFPAKFSHNPGSWLGEPLLGKMRGYAGTSVPWKIPGARMSAREKLFVPILWKWPALDKKLFKARIRLGTCFGFIGKCIN